MRFHDYQSTRPRHLSLSAEAFLDSALNDEIGPYLQDESASRVIETSHVPVLIEKAWRLINRPYYNVYPVVQKLCEKTKLDVTWNRVSFPFSPLLFRFPVGHEPHGIASALVYTVPPGNVRGFDFGQLPVFDRCWAGDPASDEWGTRPCHRIDTSRMSKRANSACGYIMSRSLVCFVQFCTDKGWEQLVWSLRADTWNETVEKTFSDPHTAGTEHLEGIDSERASLFLCRLSVLAALVGQGNDLITPEVLARDAARYELASQSEKEWIEGRASRVNGIGFSFGKELQRNSECSPHWRNPHMALFWTGANRSVPILKLRSGCVVSSTSLSDIPTGFLGDRPDDADISDPQFALRMAIPKRLRFSILRRDNYRCQLCGLTQADGVKLEVDHKVPVAKGGLTVEENLWTLCHPCNNGKSDSDIHDTATECE